MTSATEASGAPMQPSGAAAVLTLDYLRQVAAHVSEAMTQQGTGAEFEDEEVERMYAVALRLVGQADLQRAQVVLTQVCDLRPAEVRYLRALASVRRELGDLEDAASLFQMIDVLEPGNPRNGFDLAECWLRLGRFRDARILLGLTQIFCESRKISGPVAERVQALITLLDRQGGNDGRDDASPA